jgi:predicted dinucleotide-binding enzyme
VYDSYAKQLNDKIVVDLLIPVDLRTFEPIHPEQGSTAQEIASARPEARIVKGFHPAFAANLPERKSAHQTRDVLLAVS